MSGKGGKHYKQIARWGDEGVTVTFVHRVTGERQTVHEPGLRRREALRRACGRLDPAEWRADVISTPQSIFDDLTFARALITPSDRDRGREYRGYRMEIQRSAGGTITGETALLCGARCQAWL